MSEQPLFSIPVTATEIRPGDVVTSHRGSGHPADTCRGCRNVQIVCTDNRPGSGPTEGKRIVSFEWHRDGDPCGTCARSSGGPYAPTHAWDRA